MLTAPLDIRRRLSNRPCVGGTDVVTQRHGVAVWRVEGLSPPHGKWAYVLVELRNGSLGIFMSGSRTRLEATQKRQ